MKAKLLVLALGSLVLTGCANLNMGNLNLDNIFKNGAQPQNGISRNGYVNCADGGRSLTGSSLCPLPNNNSGQPLIIETLITENAVMSCTNPQAQGTSPNLMGAYNAMGGCKSPSAKYLAEVRSYAVHPQDYVVELREKPRGTTYLQTTISPSNTVTNKFIGMNPSGRQNYW